VKLGKVIAVIGGFLCVEVLFVLYSYASAAIEMIRVSLGGKGSKGYLRTR
jgi:hypothetical protein